MCSLLFSDDTVLSESVGRAVDMRLYQTDIVATSWVKHTEGGLQTSGHLRNSSSRKMIRIRGTH